jgi:predicted permease
VRRALIVGQIGLATVLLVSAGLLIRSLANSIAADLGFSARNALMASVELPHDPTGEKPLAYFRAALDRVRALPGVQAASVTTALPLARMSRRGFRIEGYVPRPGEDFEFPFLVVEPSYFETLQVDLLGGRVFDDHDDRRGARVAMVNALFAERYLGGQAIGKRITDSRGTSLEVIGVVRTGKYRTVQETVPTVYYPFAQAPASSVSIVLRTSGDPMQHAAAVRAAMTAESADAAVYRVRSLESHLSEALGGERLTASLVATCGGIALLLALVGVYGVVSYAVGSRTREIGLRVALGAAPGAIVGLVLGEGLRVLMTGLALGLAGAALAGSRLQSMLYGVGPLDVATFGIVVASLAAATVVAASLPARRALAVDPMVALRDE